MKEITQETEFNIEQITMTVEELINKTEPDFFDPISLDGYQRPIVASHCSKIINYILTQPFFFPSPIICSSRKNPHDLLWVVDGQHRIKAFKELRDNKEYNEKYEQIKNYSIPVILMVNPSKLREVEAFITINKTGRKVDTSLAYILQNKLTEENLAEKEEVEKKSKIDYLIVNLAQKVNENTEKYNEQKEDNDVNKRKEDQHQLFTIWENQISFGDSPKKEGKKISLNAFVKAERSFVKKLVNNNLINLNWNENPEYLVEANERLLELFFIRWRAIVDKWPDLFTGDQDKANIIQGPIGCSAINRFLNNLLFNEFPVDSYDQLKNGIPYCIKHLSISYDNWLRGVNYSIYSSESGYSIVARELRENCDI